MGFRVLAFIIGVVSLFSFNVACRQTQGKDVNPTSKSSDSGVKSDGKSPTKTEGKREEGKKDNKDLSGEKSFYRDISVDKAYKLWKDKKVKVVDVRTPGEYAQGRIPGAELYNLLSPDFKAKISKLDRNKTYLVYCRSGRRSAAAMKIMKELKFKRVYNMLGGMIDWSSKKYPVQK